MSGIQFARRFAALPPNRRLVSSLRHAKSHLQQQQQQQCLLQHQQVFSLQQARHLSRTTVNYARLDPYVASQYSYAFGRSDKELLYITLGDLLTQRANEHPNSTAIRSHYENIQRTFGQINEDVCRVAKSLNEKLDIQHGDVVSVWSLNSYNWIILQFAIMKIGAVLCTVNPYYQGNELCYLLRKAQVKALFMPGKGSPQEIVNGFPKVLSKALSNPDIAGEDPILLQHLITLDGEPFTDADIPANRQGAIKHHRLDALFDSNGDVSSKVLSSVIPDDPSVIMFTSGTTGKPKGAALSQFTVLNNSLLASGTFNSANNSGLNKIFCVPLPFFHSFAGIIGNLGMIASPFQLVIPCLKYDVKQVVDAINTHRVTYMMATPTLVIDLMNYLNTHSLTIPSLKGMISGGASMPIETANQFVQTVPSCEDFRIGYGATELGPCSTACLPDDTFETRTETVGKPLDFVEIKVVNPETRQLVKHGETGEIYSRGFNTMLGYWRDPAKTAEVIDAGKWYCTGDLGTMDEHGSVKIVGRTKDMIIVGGENVYPVEIEEVLHTLPGVSDAHVIGLPDDRRGEAVCAWIQMLPDAPKTTEEEVRKFCEKNMAYFKVPKYFMFVDAFPMTSTGKAQKFIMREMTCKKLGLSDK